MKHLLCLIISLILVSCQASDNYWRGNVERYDVYSVRHNKHSQYERPHHLDYQERPDRFYHSEGFDHIHHPEHRDRHNNNRHIERPCAVHDVNCIRRFFAKNSKCSPVHGPAPDPYIIERASIEIPHANVTLTVNNAQLRGLSSGKIKEFFINKKTDTLVLEVEIDRLELYSPRTVASYHHKGREPIETSDFTLIEIKYVSLTLTIPRINNLNPANGHLYSYLPSKPKHTAGPGHFDISKKGLTAKDLIWIDDIALTAREGMVTMGSSFMTVFLQSTICDFRH